MKSQNTCIKSNKLKQNTISLKINSELNHKTHNITSIEHIKLMDQIKDKDAQITLLTIELEGCKDKVTTLPNLQRSQIQA